MKKRMLIALGLTAISAGAADWQKSVSSAKPGPFPALRPLRAQYEFGWGMVSAATGEFDFSRQSGGGLRLAVQAKTVGVPRSLWRLDLQHTAVAQAATLRPLSVNQVEVYDDETLTTKLTFDSSGVARLRESRPPAAKPAKVKNFKFPGLHDLHTALLWVRSQPLQTGQTCRFVVYPTVAPYLAEVTVVGRPKLTAAGRKYDTIKLELKLRRIGKSQKLEPHKKFKKAFAWISDDPDRLLLRVEAEIFVGSVWAELETVEFTSR